MIPVRQKKNIPKGKMDLVFPRLLKIPLHFQQALPKRNINSHGVSLIFIEKNQCA